MTMNNKLSKDLIIKDESSSDEGKLVTSKFKYFYKLLIESHYFLFKIFSF